MNRIFLAVEEKRLSAGFSWILDLGFNVHCSRLTVHVSLILNS